MFKDAERWTLPSVNGPIVGTKRTEGAQRDAIEQKSEVQRARGYEDGMAVAQAEIATRTAQLDARIRRVDAILSFMSKPLAALDDEVQKQLLKLALTVGKQLARRELKADPAQIIAIIREAVSRLPAAVRDIRVHLHPEDAAIVRERLSTPSNERAWSVIEDPALSQGGCMVRTDNSQIDARLENRLNAIVSSILGDERAAARGPVEDTIVEDETVAAQAEATSARTPESKVAVTKNEPGDRASSATSTALPNPVIERALPDAEIPATEGLSPEPRK